MTRSKSQRQDPTNRGMDRRRAFDQLRARLRKSEREVKALFKSIPSSRRTVSPIINQSFYDYEFGEFDSQRINGLIRSILNRDVVDTQADQPPFDWYWKEIIEVPYRAGALEENRDMNQLIAGAIAAGLVVDGVPPSPVPPERVLFDDAYRAGLAKHIADDFNSIKGMSDDVAKQVIRVVSSGIGAGRTPTAISKEISKRFGVGISSAKRIAETQVNWAYNDARMQAALIMGKQTGLRAGVIHLSALIPTTRPHHAARHGLAFTVEQQNSWWQNDANLINCHCSVRPVLVDKSGKIINKEFQEQIKSEKAFFDKAV